MLKTTLADIRAFVAIDLTHASQQELDALPHLRQIAYSRGGYGATGGVYIDDAGKLYKVVGRVNALFYLM